MCNKIPPSVKIERRILGKYENILVFQVSYTVGGLAASIAIRVGGEYDMKVVM